MQHLLEPQRQLSRQWPLLLAAACKRSRQHQNFWQTIAWSDVSAETLARYCQMFDFQTTIRPLTSYFLPIQRAQLYAMLNNRFGFSPVGLVHIENNMQIHVDWSALQRQTTQQSLQLSTLVELLPMADNGRQICRFQSFLHPSFWMFPEHPMQLPNVLLSCQSDYLIPSKRQSNRSSSDKTKSTLQIKPEQATALATWQLSRRQGYDYAQLSGDLNPIHLSQWSARLFGQKQAIIHGMHTVAMIEARLLGASSAQIPRFDRQTPSLQKLSVQFKKPLPLGEQAHLFLSHAESGSVWQQDNLVLNYQFC